MLTLLHCLAAASVVAFNATDDMRDELDAAPFSEDTGETNPCTSHQDCRAAGDSRAMCSPAAQACVCSDKTGPLCEQDAVPGPNTNPRFVLNLLFTFLRGRCIPSVWRFLERIRARVAMRGLFVRRIFSSCGSLSVAVELEVLRNETAASVGNIKEAVRGAALDEQEATGFTETDSLDATIRSGPDAGTVTTQCTVNAENSMVTYDGRCVVLSCSSGYTRVNSSDSNGKDANTCEADTTSRSTGSGSDDLSSGVIVAIVLSSLVFVVLLLLLLFFLSKESGSSSTAAKEQPENKARGFEDDDEFAEDGDGNFIDVVV